MNDKGRNTTEHQEELERLRRRVAELESRGACDRRDEELEIKDQALRSSLSGIAWSDLGGTLTFVNPSFLTMWGYEDAGEVLGRPAASFWESGELADRIVQALRERGGWSGEMTAKKKNGDRFPVQLFATMIKGRTGAPVGMMASFLDMTERKRAEERIGYVTRLYALLGQINQAIVRTRDRDELFRTVCRVAVEFGRFRLAWIAMVDEATGVVRPVTHAGSEEGYLEMLAIRTGDRPEGKGPTGSALREGALVICDDIAADPRMLPWRDEALKRGYRSSAAIPFRLREKVIGSLNLYAEEAGFFTEDERKLLTELGADVSFALDNMERDMERQRGEAALRESEQKYRTLFDSATDGIFVLDHDGKFIDINRTGYTRLGYTKQEMLSLHISQLDPTEFAAAVPGRLAQVARQGEAVFESAHKRKDGSVMQVEVNTRLIEYDGRKAYFSIIRDITERKKMESALRESEERLQFMMSNSPAVIYTCRPSGDFGATFITRNVVHQLGYTAEEFLANPGFWAARIHPDDAPRVFAGLSALFAKGSHAHEYRFRHKDGTWRWMHDELKLVRDGNREPVEILGSWVDITDRKLAEENLGQRTRGLSMLLEVSRGLAATLDLGTVLQATTDGITKLFGQGTAAVYLLEGYSLHLGATTPPLPPDFPEKFLNTPLADHPHIQKAIASGTSLYVPDTASADLSPAERAVAEQRHLRTVLFLPLIAGVKTIGILIVGSVAETRAITEAEIDLCRTLANLAALVVENARLYDSVQQYVAELERQIAGRKRSEQQRLELERRLLHSQKLESLGVLAGGIAHDFNNILMAILGNLDLALRKLSPVSPARSNIEQSAQAARRATDLTRQMLAYSGKGKFVVKPMDLSELVQENAHLFRTGIARTTTLDLRLARSLHAIEADAGQVQQVIMNLITNASEAIGDRPGVITVSTGERECDGEFLRSSRLDEVPPAGRFVYLEVADTGCGMDEQTQQRLFDPFFSTKAAGRGLGMSAILGIVRGHRGAIFVESIPEQGTTVRIFFPALMGPPAAKDVPVTAVAAAPVAAASRTVLIVDDEEIVRNVCKDMVESFGMQALTAVDGRDAVEVFTEHADAIDLVILDLTMPNMDGMTAFEMISRIKPGVKVILSSGYNEQESIRRMSSRGLAGFIQKPYSLQDLRDAIEKAGREG